ncbi:MAG: thiol:disulfide interchange protein DsbA/DsbL [Brachymonas sp.]|nr:thiol:disulfide interchange protein DsbA/DsbL [Brachymonas sp.]
MSIQHPSSMNRRHFARLLAAGSGTALLGGLAACSPKSTPSESSAAAPAASGNNAAAIDPVAGVDYKVLAKPVASDVPKGKAELVEFFGYWCPHCATLAPTLETWRKQAPAEIVFNMVPVHFGRPSHEPLQRLFFALRDLNKLDAMHLKVFDAIHKQKVNLSTDDAIIEWAKQQPELKDSNFEQAYKGFSMAAAVSQAKQLTNDYEVDGVPSFGVAGKYFCSGTLAKGLDRALLIAAHLTMKEAKGQ